MGLWSIWSFPLLVLASAQLFQLKFEAEAEISIAGANDRIYSLKVTPSVVRVTGKSKGEKSAKVLGAFLEEMEDAGLQLDKNNELVGNKSPNGLEDEPTRGIESPRNYHSPDRTHGKASDDHRARPGAGSIKEDALYAATKRAKRSAPPALTKNLDRGVSGDTQSKERFVEAVQSGSNPRAEYRRTGDEDRGSNQRQSEPYLDTSTFALTGDSAHNQAMVHWSGHNSSVSSTNNALHMIRVTPTHVMHHPDYDYAANKCLNSLR